MAEVVGAEGLFGFLFAAREGGEKEAGEDRNDGDDDEQFDEREGVVIFRSDTSAGPADPSPGTRGGVHRMDCIRKGARTQSGI